MDLGSTEGALRGHVEQEHNEWWKAAWRKAASREETVAEEEDVQRVEREGRAEDLFEEGDEETEEEGVDSGASERRFTCVVCVAEGRETGRSVTGGDAQTHRLNEIHDGLRTRFGEAMGGRAVRAAEEEAAMGRGQAGHAAVGQQAAEVAREDGEAHEGERGLARRRGCDL